MLFTANKRIGEVSDWLKSAKKGEFIDALVNEGWARIGFHYAFHGLWKRTPYFEGIKSMLLKGGDTDTNSAIVGGILGALAQYSELPAGHVYTLLNYQPTILKRPPLFIPKTKMMDNIKTLIDLPMNLTLAASGNISKELATVLEPWKQPLNSSYPGTMPSDKSLIDRIKKDSRFYGEAIKEGSNWKK